jgi:excisionase family DNA binding protein
MEKGFMSVKELQSELGVSHVTAYTLVHSEGFPKIRIGKRILIPRDMFMNWLEKQTA